MERQKEQHAVSPGDLDLVDRARRGDREAFRELVERYQRKVAALAVGMLRSREDALDIVQDTFTKAYQSLDKFKGDSSFYTWVYRIAVNLCIDHQRRESRYVQVGADADDAGDELVPPSPDHLAEDEPFERARSTQIGARVTAAINELTPEHRAVILLREVDGLSYEEISQVLDCPKGTVMSRLHYARRQLQARLHGLR
ncbi:MAG TPA: sigma-70 family RNA polymerase sigma factor [Candidatus Eisenbacteria bacterium]|nr:sigma-70 family RNA polymerase sigma factor [Candidatus Eisenbacteria bacterium]